MDNIGQYNTKLVNAWGYKAIFDHIGQYLNVPYKTTTQTRLGWNICLSNIEQYWTIFEGIIGQYSTKLFNIGQYWTILSNMGQLETISKCS